MYGNYYGGYAPQMPMPDTLTQLRQSQVQNSIIWVQGEAAAKSYAVPFGASVPLFDTEGDVFYIKSVDASGMPMPLRTFKYVEIVPQSTAVSPQETPTQDMSKYITRDNLADILAEMGVVARTEKGDITDGE